MQALGSIDILMKTVVDVTMDETNRDEGWENLLSLEEIRNYIPAISPEKVSPLIDEDAGFSAPIQVSALVMVHLPRIQSLRIRLVEECQQSQKIQKLIFFSNSLAKPTFPQADLVPIVDPITPFPASPNNLFEPNSHNFFQ